MAPRSRGSGARRPARAPATAAERQRAESARIAGSVRPRSPRRTGPPRDAVFTPRRRDGAALRLRPSGIGLRFIACGLLSLGAGTAWRLTLAPRQLGPGSAALGILMLLSGFIVGGVLWYVRDVRLRQRDPRLVDDERLVFSFVVFCLVPLAVVLLVLVVYVIALAVGAS